MGGWESDSDPWPLSAVNVGTGLPLEGVRVLDLSRVLAGPLCAMVAGDLGADVIKVEPPSGDPVRELAPPTFGGDATYYLAVNRHRRNVVADLRDEEQRLAVERLLTRADVVVENYLPAQRAALGIDDWRARYSSPLWVSVTPASTPGPLSAEPSFDLLAQARSGLMSVTGAPDDAPTKVGAPVADVVAGLYATIGMLAGLLARAKGRSVSHVEAPLLESAMTALVNQAQGYLATGRPPRRLGNEHPSIAPYGPVTTSDGEIIVAVGTDAQYARFVGALGDKGLTERVEFAANDVRVTRRRELGFLINRAMSARTSAQWEEILRRAGVPCAPVLSVPDALAQPQISGGDFVATTTAPGGELRTLGTPLRIDGRRPTVRSGPRAFGEDQELLS